MGTVIEPISVAASFHIDTGAGAQAEAPIVVAGQDAGPTAVRMPSGGRIWGIGVSFDDVQTAGQFLVRPGIRGVPVGAQFDAGVAAGDTFLFFRSAAGQRFVANDWLEVLVETVGLTPINLHVIAWLYVIWDRGVSLDTSE